MDDMGVLNPLPLMVLMVDGDAHGFEVGAVPQLSELPEEDVWFRDGVVAVWYEDVLGWRG
jgi:hypothetical protein